MDFELSIHLFCGEVEKRTVTLRVDLMTLEFKIEETFGAIEFVNLICAQLPTISVFGSESF